MYIIFEEKIWKSEFCSTYMQLFHDTCNFEMVTCVEKRALTAGDKQKLASHFN